MYSIPARELHSSRTECQRVVILGNCNDRHLLISGFGAGHQTSSVRASLAELPDV